MTERFVIKAFISTILIALGFALLIWRHRAKASMVMANDDYDSCYSCAANAAVGMFLLLLYLYSGATDQDIFPVIHVLWFFIVSPLLVIIQLIVILVSGIRKIPISRDHWLLGLLLVIVVNGLFIQFYGYGGNVVRA